MRRASISKELDLVVTSATAIVFEVFALSKDSLSTSTKLCVEAGFKATEAAVIKI